ncbi:hypothetical protein [Candidatus Enterococcus ferrettii]|uniref:Uncharacterized protein n=1 Tax=Candidatus Enterococcus ferrettii TaxID=2815324 RepID=A0ABV0ETT2_9ENTE|nr:hypothetical protein [Enterococcus sp. 665A]MBO1342261.1 hypothetical protein [Enterococcus sp. 665A]
MKKTWAVMCGAIREELEVRLTIDKLLKMRAAKTIEGILLSTWQGEFDRFPELRQEIKANHIEIIEQAPLEKRVDLNRSTSINYMRQALQFQAALDHLPADCFVLKVRTDRALNHIKKFDAYLTKEPERIKNTFSKGSHQREMPAVFDYKIAVIGAKTHRIFNFSDFVFWGHAKDVRKLVNFDIAELYVSRDLVANTQWFIYPILRQFPIIRDYFRLINFRPLILGMKEYFERDEAEDYFPAFFYRVYAAYLLIQAHYFDLVEVNGNQYETTCHFKDLFLDKRPNGILHGPLGSVLMNNQVVHSFLDAKSCSGEASDEIFHQALWSEELFNAATNEEFDELRTFAKNKGWGLSANWLRERNWREKISEQKSEYSEPVLTYQFVGLDEAENQELLEQLKDKERVDVFLYNYWLNHPKLDFSSAEQMVLPFGRTQNQNALLILSRMLRRGLITDPKTKESLEHLLLVSFNVRVQRKTANIKTCQFMLNQVLALHSEKATQDFYSDSRTRFILDRYLEKAEFEEVLQAQFSCKELANYLYQLSDEYLEKGRDIRALRLLELAVEIDMTEEAVKKIMQIYKSRRNKINLSLATKSQTLFD